MAQQSLVQPQPIQASSVYGAPSNVYAPANPTLSYASGHERQFPNPREGMTFQQISLHHQNVLQQQRINQLQQKLEQHQQVQPIVLPVPELPPLPSQGELQSHNADFPGQSTLCSY